MSLIIGAVVIILIIAGAAFFMSGRSDSKNAAQDEVQSEKLTEKEEAKILTKQKNTETEQKKNVAVTEVEKTESVIDEEVQNKEAEIQGAKAEVKSAVQTDRKEKNKQKEELYRYINHELQTLFYMYNKGEWEELCTLGEIPTVLYKEKEKIIEGLPSFTGKMLNDYFSCIDFQENGEGRLTGYVKDISKLEEVFLQFMMPFYPYYYKQLSEGGLRYTALLHPNTLRLFQQLTGKKFRPGYRNRYITGVRAFEWDKDRYKVYQKDGRLLCDAVFDTDGIVDGYGQKKYSDEAHPDWNIVEVGSWKDGVFQSEILRYEYKKSVE